MNTQPPGQIPFPDLPEGTVTFLFTDIEGSTQLLHRLREGYTFLLADHHRILREVFTNWDGHEVDTQGDAFFVAFSRATQAVGAAVEAQRKLAEHAWPEGVTVRVRMGIHTGEPWSGEEGYVGIDVHRAARIAHVGHGGQVLLSETTTALVQDEQPPGVSLLDMSRHLLKDIHRPERISQLVIEGLQSEFPPLTSLEVLPAESSRPIRKVSACPYRGLSAFQEADAPFYFGRETFVDALERAVRTKKLVAVIVGSSGSGKSSALFAGLLPRLRKAGGYQFAIFHPGPQPFYSLAAALLPLLESTLSETDYLTETRKLAQRLVNGEVNLSQVLERVLEKTPRTQQVLLVVDQFEELYTLCPDPQIQNAFVDELLAAVDASREMGDAFSIILLTMRADFMGQALAYRPFADALQEASMLMGPMNRPELHMAIEKPAEMQGAAFEPGLVERILDDVGEKPGNLPLLEFTLTQLWEHQTDGWLTHADYEAMGCVEGALAAYADQVYADLDESMQDRARHALVQLVQPGEGTEDTRRIATREELGDESWNLIQRLAGQRLVVTGRDAQGHETVEVVHEALIQKWGRFREWMDADRAFRAWQERLRGSLRQWQESGQDEGALLAGAPLAVAQGWLSERENELNLAETDYIQASQIIQTQHQKERERRRQRTVIALVVGLVLVAVLGVVALLASQRAIQSAQTAQSEANTRATAEANALLQADLAHARELSLAAINNLDVDPERSILLAQQAVSIAQTIGDTVPIEIQDALHRSVLASHLRLTLRGHTSDVWAVAYNPDGSQLATVSWDGMAKIWDADTGQELYTLEGHRKPLWDIAFNPDGNQLVTADEAGLVILWSPKTGEVLANLVGHSGKVGKLAFSPDGKLLATSSLDQTVRVWDTSTGAELIALKVNETDNPYVAFSPDGTRLLSVGEKIQWWDTSTWHELRAFQGTTAAISPDGKRLAIGKEDGIIHLVNANTGEEQLSLSGNISESIVGIVFSPDGTHLIGHGWQNAKVWDAITGQTLFPIPESIGIKAVFTQDSSRLITSSQEGTAKVWDVATGEELLTLAGSGSIYNLALSPSCKNLLAWCGAHLATASRDQTARVWDISPAGSSELLVVPGNAVYFSQEQMRLTATEFLDYTTMRFKIWDISPEALGTVLYSYTASFPAPGIGGDLNRDGTRAAMLTADGSFTILDLVKGEVIISFPVGEDSQGFAINPDFTRLATNDSNTIHIWDPSNGQKLLDLPEFSQYITRYIYSPDGKYLVVAINPDFPEIHLLDADSYQKISSWSAYSSVIVDLAFSHDGTRLSSASMDMTAKVWQVPTGGELLTLKGHTATVFGGIFNNDDTLLATHSYDGTTKVWDAFTGQNLLTLPDAYILSFSLDGKYLASGDFGAGVANVYILDIDELADLARLRLTRSLTQEECQQYLHVEQCPVISP